MTAASLVERFETKVDRSAGPDGCHIWTGARLPKGYGSLGRVPVGERVQSQVGAHRVAFFLAHGFWPKLARHTCDNPPCVNPRHILEGDHKSNAADMVERGRAPAMQRTHCPRNHEYTEANTARTRAGHRICRECNRINARKQARRRFEKDPAAFRADALRRKRASLARKTEPCRIAGCARIATNGALCASHAGRFYRHGNAEAPLRR